MLTGVFDLLIAKQKEFDNYQKYIETVRDYWITRAQIQRVVGGRLPDPGRMDKDAHSQMKSKKSMDNVPGILSESLSSNGSQDITLGKQDKE